MPNLAEPNIPNLSYTPNRTYRIFLTLRTEHTESFLLSEPNIPNLAKPNIPKLFYILDRTYRQFLSFESDHTELTEHTNHFLRPFCSVFSTWEINGKLFTTFVEMIQKNLNCLWKPLNNGFSTMQQEFQR